MTIVLLSGALGSGKTTMLLSLAAKLNRLGKRAAILENDVGTVPVDAPVLRDHGLAVEELSAGCICCDLQTRLPIAMEKIRSTFAPEVLLIEPSGVAAPGILLNSLEGLLTPSDRIFVIYMIDIVKYVENGNQLSPFLLRSARTADVILGTKTGLAPDGAFTDLKTELMLDGCDSPVIKSDIAETWDWEYVEGLAAGIHAGPRKIIIDPTSSDQPALSVHASSYRLTWTNDMNGQDALISLRWVIKEIRRRIVRTDNLTLGTVKMAVSDGRDGMIAVSDSISPVVLFPDRAWEEPPESITLNILAYGQAFLREVAESTLNAANGLNDWKERHGLRRHQGKVVQTRL